MVTLKLLTIVAVFFGLFSYARSTAIIPAAGPSRMAIDRALVRAGYVKVGECNQPRGLLVETYELDLPSKPHYHTVARIDLISRDSVVVNFAHDEWNQDVPDQSAQGAPTIQFLPNSAASHASLFN